MVDRPNGQWPVRSLFDPILDHSGWARAPLNELAHGTSVLGTNPDNKAIYSSLIVLNILRAIIALFVGSA